MAATEDSTTMVPWPWARIRLAAASSAVTCPVKLVSTSWPARTGSRSSSSCGVSTPAAEMTTSTSPAANASSITAWWVPSAVAS